jgi:histidine triad (HIT) family protein
MITEGAFMPCLFCKIIAGEIPSKPVFEDDLTYAFRDINPQATTHVLVVPRRHIASLAESGVEDTALLGHLHMVAARIASSEGLSNGFRTVINTGPDGGQTVDHLHVHLLGGRALHWPPG